MAEEFSFWKSYMDVPLLEKEEEFQLIKDWQEKRDQRAVEALIKPYIRLVFSVAVRYRNYGVPMSDLLQEGVMGVIQAAEKFDFDRGARFSSYCRWWIRSYMQDFILHNWSVVRYLSSTSQKVLFFNLNQLYSKIQAMKNQPDCESEEIKKKIQKIIDDIHLIENRLLKPDVSLNAEITTEKHTFNFQDILKDERPTQEEVSLNNSRNDGCSELVNTFLDCLDDEEIAVIKSRWLQEHPEDIASLANQLGINKNRIKQIEVKAIRKMRSFNLQNVTNIKKVLE